MHSNYRLPLSEIKYILQITEIKVTPICIGIAVFATFTAWIFMFLLQMNKLNKKIVTLDYQNITFKLPI